MSYFGSSSSVKHASDCECDACSLTSQSCIPPSTSLITTTPALRHLTLHGGRNRSAFSGLKPVKAKIWSVLLGQTSGAAAANIMNQYITLTTSNFPELSSFMTVYDTFRIVSGVTHYIPFLAVSGNPGLSTGSICTMFDNTAGNPTSTNSVLEETFSQGPFSLVGVPSQGVNRQAYHKLHWTPPKIAPVGTNTLVGRAWVVLDATNAPGVCVVQAYQTPGTGLTQNALNFFIELEVEFRIRT